MTMTTTTPNAQEPITTSLLVLSHTGDATVSQETTVAMSILKDHDIAPLYFDVHDDKLSTLTRQLAARFNSDAFPQLFLTQNEDFANSHFVGHFADLVAKLEHAQRKVAAFEAGDDNRNAEQLRTLLTQRLLQKSLGLVDAYGAYVNAIIEDLTQGKSIRTLLQDLEMRADAGEAAVKEGEETKEMDLSISFEVDANDQIEIMPTSTLEAIAEAQTEAMPLEGTADVASDAVTQVAPDAAPETKRPLPDVPQSRSMDPPESSTDLARASLDDLLVTDKERDAKLRLQSAAQTVACSDDLLVLLECCTPIV